MYSAENTRLGSSRSGSTPSMQIIDKGSGYVAFYAPSGNLGPPGTVWWKAFDGFTTSYANPIGGSGSNYLWFSYSGEENFVDNTIDNFSIVNGTPYYFYKAFNPEISTTLVYKSTVKFLDSVIDAANNVGELQIQSYLGYGYVRWYPLGNNYSLSNVVLNDAEPSSPEYVDNSPYAPGGNSGVGGGDGTFGKDETSDDVSGSIPSGSTEADASDTGIYTRYLLNTSGLKSVGKLLWNSDVLNNVAKAIISILYNSPAESVISLHGYPFDISQFNPSLTDGNITWGSVVLDKLTSYKILNSSSVQIDWGSVSTEEFWGNFLDYAPYTKLSLYLPWGTGFVPIDANECVPGTISVKSNIELDKGTCVHTVIGTNTRTGNTTVLGTYSTVVAKMIPVTSIDTSAKTIAMVATAVQAALSLGGSLMAGAETSSAGAVTTETALATTSQELMVPVYNNYDVFPSAGASGAGSAMPTPPSIPSAAALAKAPSEITRNGSFVNGTSGLCIQYPYLVITRPIQSVPENYGHHYGYPSNIYANLRSLSGYTEVGAIHLENMGGATSAECSEIEKILHTGVIF